MLQGWETRTVEQTPTPMKPTQLQASELAREAPKEQEELAHESEFQPRSDPTPKESESPQPSSKNLDDMAVAARWIMIENPDIAQWMMEHLKT